MRGRLLIDTNLLVLLMVGKASIDFVTLHKRTRAYTIDDYALLDSIAASASTLVTTPNILSETSNLIRQFSQPRLAVVIEAFRGFVGAAAESYYPSAEAVRRSDFERLGLTDVVILRTQEDDVTLLTDDLDLYLASALARKKALNFTYERARWLS